MQTGDADKGENLKCYFTIPNIYNLTPESFLDEAQHCLISAYARPQETFMAK